MMAAVLTLEDHRTWPARLATAVRVIAATMPASERHTLDLPVKDADDELIDSLLADQVQRYYHATRLLPHEIESVWQHGLRLLDDQLVADRLAWALDGAALLPQEADALERGRVRIDGAAGRRHAQVCAVASTHTFTHDAHGVWPLMTHWGGEGIYFAQDDPVLRQRLRGIGTPAIVVLHASAAGPLDEHYPAQAKLFVGSHLGLADVAGDVFLREHVTSAQIEGVWTPGNPDYDRFPDLPRA